MTSASFHDDDPDLLKVTGIFETVAGDNTVAFGGSLGFGLNLEFNFENLGPYVNFNYISGMNSPMNDSDYTDSGPPIADATKIGLKIGTTLNFVENMKFDIFWESKDLGGMPAEAGSINLFTTIEL